MGFAVQIFDDSGILGNRLGSYIDHHPEGEVKVFKDYQDQLQQLEQAKPNLAIICQPSHGGDALNLCRQLCQHNASKSEQIPILLIAHDDTQGFSQQGLSAGATDVISLPLKEPDFIAEVEKLINAMQPTHAADRSYRSFHDQLDQQFHVLVAEDTQLYQMFYQSLLESIGCKVTLCENGQRAWQLLNQGLETDLIVSDINMPIMDGEALIEKVRADQRFDKIAILVATSIDQIETLTRLFDIGANDHIAKPINEAVFISRVRSHLHTRQLILQQQQLNQQLKEFNKELDKRVKERTEELYQTQMDVIKKLSKASEYKDDDTGNHIQRVSHFCQAIADAAALDEDLVEEIRYSSMMHDIGKMAIPDAILQKPGRLTPQERSIMETHALLGEELLGNKPFFKQAALIAGGHHEKWDGSGYPRGLSGEDIPMAARITAIADVFDALLSRRCYKEPKSLQQALEIMQEGHGQHFDPNLLDLFFKLIDDRTLIKIMDRFPYEKKD